MCSMMHVWGKLGKLICLKRACLTCEVHTDA